MKNIFKLLVAGAILLSASTSYAQNESDRWSFAIGINAIDLYPVGEEDNGLGGYFDEFFNTSHYNVLPAPSRFEVGYYVGDGIVATGAFSVNSIDTVGDTSITEISYYSFDGGLRYNLAELWNGEIVSPYLGVGGSYQILDNDGFGTFNGTLGLDVKIVDGIYANVQSTYKHAFEDAFPKHFQHTVGVKFTWGAVDTDGDGIVDSKDECPTVAGLEQFNGCPDSDMDGIQDSKDDCPNVFGPAETNGCPDSDGDSVLDKDDKCPQTAGLVALMGCPDADNDGVADADDKCPNEAGPASRQGCPVKDRDNDGIEDAMDKCPDVAGIAELQGCPRPVVPTVEVQAQLNEYAKTILFDTNKDSIQKESEEVLADIIAILKKYPEAKFEVDGHTDSDGPKQFNQRLSEARALSVKNYLVANGVNEFRLSSKGFGETQPVASNKTRAGKAQNRRVEINLIK
ncbi:outer membrane protein OmpA-like peptidoglycan-associated protein [Nonlabens dokdonensis]|uniref:Outer membrane protein OmpA-like peptidoglycan-associated protein n=2 Tax=Nonlabens dokdonensis TaxID=328515 RepID=A0ABX5Q1E4_9FLAO|nr:OmpA family protein [Nonlabens dokdonensis]AGC76226.1 putative outer membrane protein, ompA family [Nonlabens dokdonensis DSW-6]PZX43890.1 outer membrane protein OmpA-like peptidoglycan-associated protein [Nonlabens dokdonensis]